MLAYTDSCPGKTAQDRITKLTIVCSLKLTNCLSLGFLHLIFLDHVRLLVTKTTESKRADKGGTIVSPPNAQNTHF